MLIRIASLRDGLNRWLESVHADDLEIDPTTYPHSVEVEIEADKRGGKIAVEVKAQTEGLFVCDRCGKDFHRFIGGDCAVMFIRREEPLPDEMPGDDLRSFILGQEKLDITTEVRDALLLSLPLKILCRDDCLGLCPDCGANLNDEECRCKQRVISNEPVS